MAEAKIRIVDYATGVPGTYCIERDMADNPIFVEFWNPRGWAGSGYVFNDVNLVRAVIELLAAHVPQPRPVEGARGGPLCDNCGRVKDAHVFYCYSRYVDNETFHASEKRTAPSPAPSVEEPTNPYERVFGLKRSIEPASVEELRREFEAVASQKYGFILGRLKNGLYKRTDTNDAWEMVKELAGAQRSERLDDEKASVEELRREFEAIATSQWGFGERDMRRDGDEYAHPYLQARWEAYLAGAQRSGKGVGE